MINNKLHREAVLDAPTKVVISSLRRCLKS
jgi:hypothetical protein